MDVATLAVTSAIALIGLWLAHDIRRQQRLKIADQRIVAYQKLWKLMEVARPTRLDGTADKGGPLTRDEALTLYKEMTAWYYDSGHGMLLPHETKVLYIAAKKHLGRYADTPTESDYGQHEGTRRIQELSLLRTQMKRDLDIYGIQYSEQLNHEDVTFIREAGLNPDAWAGAYWLRVIARRARAYVRGRLSKLFRVGTPR